MGPDSLLSPELKFSRRNRFVLYYLLGLAVVVLLFAVVYNVTLSRLEGVNQSIFASIEFVIQTMTTTGYGQDSGLWSHPLMFVVVSLTQITGIGIGFFTLRMIIIPLFTGAEVNLDNRLTPKQDHVIVCEYRRDSAVLLNELDELGVEYVLISSSREEAKRLSDDGFPAIHGSPQDAETFERASIDSARAVITDTGEASVDTILTVRSMRQDIEIITLTDDSSLRDVLLETGADSVLSPRGVLHLPPDPDTVIRPSTVLLVSGPHDALEAFTDFTRPARSISRGDSVVIAGVGEVGRAAQSVVTEADIDTRAIDIDENERVDVVADATSEAGLREVGIENAGAVIVCLPDDSASMLTTVLSRSLNPDIEVLTRVSDTDATRKALSAGADYVLSVPRVSARMVAGELRGEDVLAPASQIRIIRVSAQPFADSTLADSNIYEQTGCLVIAVEDDTGLSSTVDPEHRFTGDEQIVLVGTDEAVKQFRKQFDVTPVDTGE